LRLLGGTRGAWAATGSRGAGAYIVSPRAQLVITVIIYALISTPYLPKNKVANVIK